MHALCQSFYTVLPRRCCHWTVGAGSWQAAEEKMARWWPVVRCRCGGRSCWLALAGAFSSQTPTTMACPAFESCVRFRTSVHAKGARREDVAPASAAGSPCPPSAVRLSRRRRPSHLELLDSAAPCMPMIHPSELATTAEEQKEKMGQDSPLPRAVISSRTRAAANMHDGEGVVARGPNIRPGQTSHHHPHMARW